MSKRALTPYMSRDVLLSPIKADRSHSGGHLQDSFLVRTPPFHPRLQMEQSHFTWLILASCSDASALMVLWCQRKASGLDKTPHGWIPALSMSLRAVWLSVHLRPVWSPGCPVHSHPLVNSAAETVKTHRNVHYMCLFRWIFFHASSPEGWAYECVCMCVCLIYSGRQTITLT